MPRLGRALIALIGALMLAVLAGGAHAELKPINPLAAEGAAPPSAFSAPSAAQQSPGAFGGIFGWVLRTQQSLQRDLATGVKNLKGEHVMAGAAMLVLASFIYGVVHAVGPGHGKMVISSYVVANEATVRRGVIISFIAAALQALTAIALVGILAFALNAFAASSVPGSGFLTSAVQPLTAGPVKLTGASVAKPKATKKDGS
jgi:hypothetical protein